MILKMEESVDIYIKRPMFTRIEPILTNNGFVMTFEGNYKGIITDALRVKTKYVSIY